MAEHVMTTGDVGRSPQDLRGDFPWLDGALRHLPEVWWWSPDGKPNCAATERFSSAEPRGNLARRVGAFRAWAIAQPERHIIAFGHSTFWKYFIGNGERLANCEVHTMAI